MTSGRAALVGNQVEQDGYGMYSYVLVGTQPTAANRDRYLQVFSSFVTSLPDLGGLESSGFPRSKLNVTYVLLKEAPPPELLKGGGSAEQGRAFAEWALTHYDYARANALLKSVPEAKGDGPYLISTLHPLRQGQTVQGGYLYQDLSSVEIRCIKTWIAEFFDGSSRPMTRDRTAAEELAQKLREVLARAAGPCPQDPAQVQRWVRWRNTS